jgi:hypothetical protein
MSTPGNGLSSGQYADSGSVARRPAPPPDNTNFASQDPNTVYTQVQAADPGQVGNVAQSWTNMGSALEAVNQVLSTGAAAGANGWSGAAASKALGFHTQVAQWTAVATQASYEAGGNVSSQSDAASTAKYSMPKPVNYGMPQALADFAANPFDVGAIHDKFRQAQDNHQQIAHVVQQYDVSLNQASQQMPALGPTPAFASGNQPGGGSVPGGSSGGAARLVTGSGRVGGSGGRVAAPGPVSGAPIDSEPGTSLSGTGGSSLGGNGNPSGGGPSGGNLGGGGVAGGGVADGGDPGGGVLPIGPGGGFGGGGGSSPDGRLGRGGGSSFGGRSGFGAERSGGVGVGGGGARSAVGGGSAGSEAGAVSAAEQAGARGAAGPAGAGGIGAGRGRKGADEEHQRPSYLVERDPESIFGVDETTAPPVIGA